ncbi:MAG: DUF2961 domain-containing protein [Chthonomonadaceae bacterium]|nr:DUF2961 domain-containing protein [Chthonomonadaceae bacterium]
MIASLFLSALALAPAPTISVKTLLPEMTDLARLAHRPSPAYTLSQASSYDRKSLEPGNDDWFANADYGQFIRTIEVGSRKEHVMADLKGPGAVVRIWSANPNGVIRFYFDGEATPRFAPRLADLLSGKTPGLGEPFGYMADRGANLYFPFPYSKSLLITVDDDGAPASRLYYHVGYRTYTEPVDVVTFTPAQIAENAAAMKRIASELEDPGAIPTPAGETVRAEWTLAPGSTEVLELPSGPRAIRTLRMRATAVASPGAAWTDPNQTHNVLRRVLLNIQADDEDCVSSPLGDFFGAAPGIQPYQSVPFSVAADGTMTSRWVMPYREDALVIATNINTVPVKVTVEATASPMPFDASTYYFRAQWGGENGSTRPHHDMTFLNASGEGVWVGSMLHVANPVPSWWGEGDEKVSVDGERFPSTFGTGTEDYYGYAWSSNKTFQRPYHAQPHSETPGNRGHSVVNRWHIFDPIPFRKSIRFDIENWHWADTTTAFLHTAYWYSAPGGSGPGSINQALLAPPEIVAPKPVEGAIEGESLVIASRSGGTTEAQEGFWETSGEKQLWWKDVAKGDTLVLRVPVPKAGRYTVVGHFCMATDYGIHTLTLNGKELGTFDFYSPTLKWEKKTLGEVELPAGEVSLEVRCAGEHAGAIPSRMFGLDYLLLVPK